MEWVFLEIRLNAHIFNMFKINEISRIDNYETFSDIS